MTNDYECVVIGGSVAGLSAALMLGRARRKTLVIDAGDPINATVDHSHGFLSRDGIAPKELVAIARAQLEPYPVELVDGRVTEVRRVDTGFVVTTESQSVTATDVVVATGIRIALPDVPGLADVWGRGAGQCPYCHGWEVRDLPLAVIAGDPMAPHLASMLTQWSPDVTVYELPDASFTVDASTSTHGWTVASSPIAAIEHDGAGQATGIRMVDGTLAPCGGVFLAQMPSGPRIEMLDALDVQIDDTGWPVLDAYGRSSEPGLWFVGNAASRMANLIASAASGSLTAAALNGARLGMPMPVPPTPHVWTDA